MRTWLAWLGDEDFGEFSFPEEYTLQQVRAVLIAKGYDPRIQAVQAED